MSNSLFWSDRAGAASPFGAPRPPLGREAGRRRRPVPGLLEADGPNLEAESLPGPAVVAGEEVDQGQLTQLSGSHLEDGFRLLVGVLGLKKDKFCNYNKTLKIAKNLIQIHINIVSYLIECMLNMYLILNT